MKLKLIWQLWVCVAICFVMIAGGLAAIAADLFTWLDEVLRKAFNHLLEELE